MPSRPHAARFFLIAALASLSLAPTSHARIDPVDVLAGEMLGQSIGNAINSVNEGIQGIVEGVVEFNVEISTARQRYFALYPDGDGVEEAADEFARLLFAKDLAYIMFHADTNVGDKHAQAINRMSRLITEQIDGGIPELANGSFYDLKEAMQNEVGGQLPSVRGYLDAIKKCEKQWAAYGVVRNYAEFRAAGIEYPGIDTPEGYVYLIALLYGRPGLYGPQISPEQAENAYANLVSKYGEDLVNDVVARVRQAPKNDKLVLDDIESFGLVKTQRADRGYNNTPAPQGKIIVHASDPWSAILGLILDHSDENYAIFQLGNQYEHAVRVYGKDVVIEAANKARNAPKRMEDGQLIERQGRHPLLIPHFIQRELRASVDMNSDDLKGLLMYFFDTGNAENSRELAEAAYQELAALKGEEALLEAAAELQKHGWNLKDAGIKTRDLKNGLKELLVGVQISNENYIRWARFLPYSSVAYDVHIIEPGVTGKDQVMEVFLNGCSEEAAFLKYRTVYLRNNQRLEGDSEAYKLDPFAQYDQTSFVPRDWIPAGPRTQVLGKETIDVLGKPVTCMKVLHDNEGLNFRAEVWLSDQIPGGVAKAVMSGTDPGFFVKHTFTVRKYEAIPNDKFDVPDWFDLTGLEEIKLPQPTPAEVAEQQKQQEEKMNRRRGRLRGQ